MSRNGQPREPKGFASSAASALSYTVACTRARATHRLRTSAVTDHRHRHKPLPIESPISRRAADRIKPDVRPRGRARHARSVNALGRAQADAVELLREVHHRVKNSLQVMQSLLALEASRLSHPDARRVVGVIQDRLRAVALVHDQLHRSSNLRYVDLRGYVVAVIDGVRRSHDFDGRRIHVRVRGSQGLVGMNDALRVGLMLNELVSNAAMHALSGGRGGEILVSVSFCPRRRLRIKVSNTGVPLPARFSPPVDRLGLAIVGNIARHSGGRLWWSRRPLTSFYVELKRS